MRTPIDPEIASMLKIAKQAFEDGRLSAGREVLAPLVAEGIAAAIRLDCCHSDADTPEHIANRNYVDGMHRAAALGDVDALYAVGALYDLGEYVELDKEKASAFFKKAADHGHAHSMWIHACELLWGRGSFDVSVNDGLRFLSEAVECGSAEACITTAGFHLSGELGFPKNESKAAELRDLAKRYDASVHDPYA